MTEAAAPVPKLSVTAVSSGYGAINIIDTLSMTVPHGQIFALMGKNGMGKTTLLKTILGFVAMRSGSIDLDGQPIAGASPASLIASGVAYAPQEHALFQDLTIRDNLRLALHTDKELKQGIERVCQHFPFLRERVNQKAGTLSGGEQKMLILGRALMLQPKLLLIDEISEGLQPSVVERIGQVLVEECRASNTTVLMVEQNLDLVLGIANRWAVLKLGRIDDSGEMDSEARARILAHLKI